MNTLKETIARTMITTGASLVFTAIFFIFAHIPAMPIRVLFEVFGANIVINAGILLTHKIESRFIILEYLLDITYISIVLSVFGFICNWYENIHVLFLIAAAVVVYALTVIISISRVKKDTDTINAILRKRNSKNADTAS